MAGKRGLHLVHGEWMTIADAAERLDIKLDTLYHWRALHHTPQGTPGLLVDAWDYYDGLRRGTIQRKPTGPAPKLYRYRGKRMPLKQVARTMGLASIKSIYCHASRHNLSVQKAIERMDARMARQAEREILRIIRDTEMAGAFFRHD